MLIVLLHTGISILIVGSNRTKQSAIKTWPPVNKLNAPHVNGLAFGVCDKTLQYFYNGKMGMLWDGTTFSLIR